MFTSVQSLCSRAWRALVSPTVRLKADFPWTPSKMAKHYLAALALYIVGSIVPIALAIGGMFVLNHYNRPALLTIFGENLKHKTTITVVLTVLSFLCGFGLQVWYIARVLRADGLSLRKMLGLSLNSLGGSWWSAVWRAAVTVVLSVGLAQLVHLLPCLPESNQEIARFMKSLRGLNLAAIALLAAVAAPLFEEIVFRGFLCNMLRTQLSKGKMTRIFRSQNAADWGASIVSAAIFAAVHFEPSAMPGLFIFGILLAELYRRSGSLLCPMLAHSINNTLAVVLIIVSILQ